MSFLDESVPAHTADPESTETDSLETVQPLASTALVPLGEMRQTLEAGRPSTADALAMIDALEEHLARLTGVEDVKNAVDVAATIESLLRRRRTNLLAANTATALRLRAERRLDELLRGTVRAGWHRARLPEGVTADLASRCRRLGEIPVDVFERIIDEKRGVEELSAAAVLRWAAASRSYRPYREERPAPPKTPVRPIGLFQAGQEGDVVPLAHTITVADLLEHFPDILDVTDTDGTITAVLVRPRGVDERDRPLPAAEPHPTEDPSGANEQDSPSGDRRDSPPTHGPAGERGAPRRRGQHSRGKRRVPVPRRGRRGERRGPRRS